MKVIFLKHKYFLFILILIFSVFSLSFGKNAGNVLPSFDSFFPGKELIDDFAVNDFIKKMPLEQKICQMLLVSLDSNSLSNVGNNTYEPGGYLFFAFNFNSDIRESRKLSFALKQSAAAKNQIVPFISTDFEGGIVNRLNNIAFHFPSERYIAEKFSLRDAFLFYYYQNMQLKCLGVDVNLAPVVEVVNSDNEEFLGSRSFGDFSKTVKYSYAAINAVKKAGVYPVLKHFPGNTKTDPHKNLPEISFSSDESKNQYLKPFDLLLNDSDEGLLVAHTILNDISDLPSCLSEAVIEEFIRKKKFNGLLFSDDLLMDALLKNGFPLEKSLVMAVRAGIDVIMISKSSYQDICDILVNAVETDSYLAGRIDESVSKILKWKIKQGLLKLSYNNDNGIVRAVVENNTDFRSIYFDENDFYSNYKNAERVYNSVLVK